MERTTRGTRGIPVFDLEAEVPETELEAAPPKKRGRPRKGEGLGAQIASGEVGPRAGTVVIEPPRFETGSFHIRGIAPLVIHAFSQKAIGTMIETQKAGQQARSKRKRSPKDFDAVYNAARHVAGPNGKDKGGWDGFSASAIRNAGISACRTVGFKMTLAKLSLFVEADGWDRNDGTGLIRITKGKPKQNFMPARNDNGSTDIRCRPMWDPGWEATVRITWDADQFSASDVGNLIARIGKQVGIGEGRPDSKNSAGMGWGRFEVLSSAELKGKTPWPNGKHGKKAAR